MSNEPITGPNPPETQARAILKTRCGCERKIVLPLPVPREVMVDLSPPPGKPPHKWDREPEKRRFVLVGSTQAVDSNAGESFIVYIYTEEAPISRLIQTPGLILK